MKFLGELTQKEVGIPNPKEKSDRLRIRRTVRAIAFNKEGMMPLLYFEKTRFHTLPGGSFESDEGLTKGLRREFKEEVGSDVSVTDEVGVIVSLEFCSDTIQINYCFLGEVGMGCGNVEYSEEEKAQKPTIKWVTLDEAIRLLKSDQPVNDTGRFCSSRDLQFCSEARTLIDNKCREKGD